MAIGPWQAGKAGKASGGQQGASWESKYKTTRTVENLFTKIKRVVLTYG